MGIEQLINAYKGNPEPLQAKVQKAQQGQPPGSIPPDLEEAIALQKITELRQGSQNQQAMQAGGAQPSVVEKLKQMLASAEQRQQAQPPQMPQGMPQDMPQGQPQMAQAGGPPPQGQPPQGQPPVMAARGGSIAQLMSNLGRHYAGGGIVAFNNGGDVRHFEEGDLVVDPMGGVISSSKQPADDLTFFERIGLFNPENRRAIEKAERVKKEREALGLKPGEVERGRQPDPRSAANRFPDAKTQLAESAAFAKEIEKPPVPSTGIASTTVARDNAPMPAGLAGLPSVGVGRDYERRMLAENQKFDPEAYKKKYMQEVGAKDLSIYDEMAAELKARKERLKNPEPGFDSLMEYLGQIAQGGNSRNWMEAGAKGAAGVKALQKERQTQQDALVDKILDIGSKKKEAEYTERLGLFNLTKAEKDRIETKSDSLAKSLGLSEDKEIDLRQQMTIELMKIKAQKEISGMPGSEQKFFNQMASDWLSKPENKGKTMFDAYSAFKIAGAPSAASKGMMTRDQAADNVRKNIEYGAPLRTQYMNEATQALNKVGIASPNATQIMDYLVERELGKANATTTSSATVPTAGTVMNGYKFKGGDPGDKNNWEKV